LKKEAKEIEKEILNEHVNQDITISLLKEFIEAKVMEFDAGSLIAGDS